MKNKLNRIKRLSLQELLKKESLTLTEQRRLLKLAQQKPISVFWDSGRMKTYIKKYDKNGSLIVPEVKKSNEPRFLNRFERRRLKYKK